MKRDREFEDLRLWIVDLKCGVRRGIEHGVKDKKGDEVLAELKALMELTTDS